MDNNQLIIIIILIAGYYYLKTKNKTEDKTKNKTENNNNNNWKDKLNKEQKKKEKEEEIEIDTEIEVVLKSCGNYISVEDNNNIHTANKTIDSSTKFSIIDLKQNGGLYDSDVIVLKHGSKGYLSEVQNQLVIVGAPNLKHVSEMPYMKFEIKKIDKNDKIIKHGDLVTLKSLSNNKYITAEGCRGGKVSINREGLSTGPYAKFIIYFTDNNIPENINPNENVHVEYGIPYECKLDRCCREHRRRRFDKGMFTNLALTLKKYCSSSCPSDWKKTRSIKWCEGVK